MRNAAKVLILLLGVGLLAACNTVAGAGEDIEAGGKAVQKGSENVQKKL